MPAITQLVISEESKPGTLANVASVLGSAGVNIKAFSAPEVAGHGHLRLLVNDVEKAKLRSPRRRSSFGKRRRWS